MVTVSVRPARPGDAAAVGLVHVRAWQAAYQGLMDAVFLETLDPEAAGDRWAARLADRDDPSRTFVAARGGRLCGFVTIGPCRDDDLAGQELGELIAINVDPALWRLGVGQALHDEAIAALAAEGYAEATLWVIAGNDAARAFYAGLGWKPDETSRVVEMGGADVEELRYRIELATHD